MKGHRSCFPYYKSIKKFVTLPGIEIMPEESSMDIILAGKKIITGNYDTVGGLAHVQSKIVAVLLPPAFAWYSSGMYS
jgi:hypothetical protein